MKWYCTQFICVCLFHALWYKFSCNSSPLHLNLSFLGSGSHSPFDIHVAIDVFGPVSIIPVGQLKLMVAPSNDGLT